MALVYVAVILMAGHIGLAEPGRKADIKQGRQLDVRKLVVEISRSEYAQKLHGFWLAQSIGNWTGLITEMDKVGKSHDVDTGPFYTREDWGREDQPAIWDKEKPDRKIDFVLKEKGEVWGSDDDTDIEYMYQHLLHSHKTSLLTPEQIREGWLKHIRKDEENYLWVSNEKAFHLMHEGLLPPQTGSPDRNPYVDMIDAQLSTEIFGFFAPSRPSEAILMAHLPIRTVARKNAAWISEFYVRMYSLASHPRYKRLGRRQSLVAMAKKSRAYLPKDSYAAKMFDYVLHLHSRDLPWELTRDLVNKRYQVEHKDDYDHSDKYANGGFAAGINFAASIISLLYGEGDLKETIKIGSLMGWDSDNPTATWAGLIGFMIGKEGVEIAFGKNISNRFNIHRTRRNFPVKDGIDTFEHMAEVGVQVVDRVVVELLGGTIDVKRDCWLIPLKKNYLSKVHR
ncbi:MAG: ADP-ribosylglycohydrolase family protein [Planctomycetes bacterium]|nr:ADP-ribosylglycohydrolase family protein [Planctomycetota bacterium]